MSADLVQRGCRSIAELTRDTMSFYTVGNFNKAEFEAERSGKKRSCKLGQ